MKISWNTFSTTKKQNKNYKKTEVKADRSKVVLCLRTDFVESKNEEEEWSDTVVSEMALKTIDEFVNDIKNKIIEIHFK